MAAPNVVWRAPGGRPLVRWKRREIAAEQNGQPRPEPHSANVSLGDSGRAGVGSAETIDAQAKDLAT